MLLRFLAGAAFLVAPAMPGWAQQADEDGIGTQITTSVIPIPRIVYPGDEAEVETPDETAQDTETSLADPVTRTVPGTQDAQSDQFETSPLGNLTAEDPEAQGETPQGETGSEQEPALEQETDTPRVVTATTDEATESRWQRARARRFQLAPKTPGRLDYSTETAPIVPIDGVDTELKTGATLRQLDKMTGQIQTFEMAIGEVRKVARLRLRLNACRAPEDNDLYGTMAFLQIWDTKKLEQPPAFSGWMLADSPALSALDHPRYDVWLINCKTSSAEASAASE